MRSIWRLFTLIFFRFYPLGSMLYFFLDFRPMSHTIPQQFMCGQRCMKDECKRRTTVIRREDQFYRWLIGLKGVRPWVISHPRSGSRKTAFFFVIDPLREIEKRGVGPTTRISALVHHGTGPRRFDRFTCKKRACWYFFDFFF